MSLLTRKNKGNSHLRSASYTPFERFFRNDFLDLWNGNPDTVPSVNIKEQKDRYLVELAAPGLKKEDFSINIENDILTVSCEQESEAGEGEESEGFTRREYNYSSFSRSLALPENSESSGISARYEDGVLRLSIPKKPEAQKQNARKIKVD